MAGLSQDDLYEIFSWLPAKSICKFKSSCKYISEFSTKTYFTMTQAQNFFSKDDSCFFVEPASCQRYSDRIEIHTFSADESSSGVSGDFVKFLAKSARILASSNGLLLCRSVGKNPVELFLCNPATQSWLPIPAPEFLLQNPNVDINVAFECNKGSLDSEDYMIFFIENSDDWSSNLECKLYLPKEKTWKSMGKSLFTGSRNLRFELPVFHDGALHYISDTFPSLNRNSAYFRPYIVAYNHLRGISTILRLPKEARRGSHDKTCNMKIFKWGKTNNSKQSICLLRLRKSVFTVWILVNYESNSWQRILKIRVKALLGSRERDFIVTGFNVLNGDSLIFATEKKIYKYDLAKEGHSRLEEIGEHECGLNVLFKSYSNTLRPCGIGATIMMPNNDISLEDYKIDSFGDSEAQINLERSTDS